MIIKVGQTLIAVLTMNAGSCKLQVSQLHAFQISYEGFSIS